MDGSFWSGFDMGAGSSPLDDLLAKDDVTLEEIMACSEVFSKIPSLIATANNQAPL